MTPNANYIWMNIIRTS